MLGNELSRRFFVNVAIFEIAILVLFAVFVRSLLQFANFVFFALIVTHTVADSTLVTGWWMQGLCLCCLGYGDVANSDELFATTDNEYDPQVNAYYPMFQDVHVMMFIGFGFLMTFLKRYSLTAIGFNFFISAVVIQWYLLCHGFWDRVFEGFHDFIQLDLVSLIVADYAVAAVLISWGAVIGRITPLQLLYMSVFEIILYSLNEVILVLKLGVVDLGGTIIIHMFGAYFGLSFSWVLKKIQPRLTEHSKSLNGSNYTSDIFAMIGTLFLWMYWPSFNAAAVHGSQQTRTIINTLLSLTASCIVTFAWSGLLRHGGKFSMVDVQNATLAGGVAIGASSNYFIQPYGALCIGSIAGTLSVVGYVYIMPQFMEKRLGILDTCGVHNLHGMPSLLGGFASVIALAVISPSNYLVSGIVNPTQSGPHSAYYQLASMACTLGIAIAGGLFSGLVLSKFLSNPKDPFDDDEYWEIAPTSVPNHEELDNRTQQTWLEMHSNDFRSPDKSQGSWGATNYNANHRNSNGGEWVYSDEVPNSYR